MTIERNSDAEQQFPDYDSIECSSQYQSYTEVRVCGYLDEVTFFGREVLDRCVVEIEESHHRVCMLSKRQFEDI